jgi:hypothetical protein
MSHKFLIPLLAAACLVAPAVLPSALVSAMAPGLSGAAQAAWGDHETTSGSLNSYRTTKSRSHVTTPKAPGGTQRMGGGGGGRTKMKVGGSRQ